MRRFLRVAVSGVLPSAPRLGCSSSSLSSSSPLSSPPSSLSSPSSPSSSSSSSMSSSWACLRIPLSTPGDVISSMSPSRPVTFALRPGGSDMSSSSSSSSSESSSPSLERPSCSSRESSPSESSSESPSSPSPYCSPVSIPSKNPAMCTSTPSAPFPCTTTSNLTSLPPGNSSEFRLMVSTAPTRMWPTTAMVPASTPHLTVMRVPVGGAFSPSVNWVMQRRHGSSGTITTSGFLAVATPP
ncbi:hypothetical protein T484DRAFT_1958384 [Baffinella frigidus]|nr:hypothetical protein T484DRAFT_1958384 [Cryptophyta sp. CCMP2293]